MTATQQLAKPARPTYGNWVQQRSPGLMGTGTIATAVLVGGMLLCMLVFVVAQFIGALIAFLFVAIAFIAVGTPVGKDVVRHIGYTRSRNKREHQWRSGMFSSNSRPRTRLPGILSKAKLISAKDSANQPFAVVRYPRYGGMYTIIVRCVAEGPWMQDQERINYWVASYAQFLSNCGQERALVCAKAITDTAPDPGGRLGAMVRSMRSPNSPSVARAVMDECIDQYPSASSENITYIELTYRGRMLNRKGDERNILNELSRRVPGILTDLQTAGGGTVEMVPPEDLPKILRVAYDPASQELLERAELSGITDSVDWNEAGPVAAQDYWDRYVHDSGVSVTWEMHAPPRAAITEMAMSGVLMPHSDFMRKRVALVYRPHSPEDSLRVSENDANTATFVAKQSKKRTSAAATLYMRATEQGRQEVASGAVLTRFSILITATVGSMDQLPQAISTIESRAGTVPLRLRKCFGSQASAFAATLPVGFVPWEFANVPDKVREWM